MGQRFWLIAFMLSHIALASAEDWPQFRGPDGQGHSAEKNVPLTWSETENIISCDGRREQSIVALDKHTGKIVWKRLRPNGRQAYSTPLVIQLAGKSDVVSTGGDRVTAYDPRTGEDVWWSRYVGYSLVPRPVYGHGLVFVCSGFDPPATLYAIRPDGHGDVTDSHVAWSLKRTVPLTPSPLLVGSELFIVSDDGIATCLDAKTGTQRWRNRLGGKFSASPVSAAGRIYFLDEDGLTTVIAADSHFKQLATNQLDGRTLASIAISDSAIFLRTDSHLYRIESLARGE